MTKRHNLTVTRHIFHRLLFKHDIAGDIIKRLRIQNHIASVNPADVLFTFFAEGKHFVAVEVQIAESTFGLNCGYRANFSVRLVEFQKLVDIHVRNAVAVCEEKFFAVDIGLNFFYATTRQSFVAGIDNCNFPRLGKVIVYLYSVFALEVKRHVAVVERVVREKFFDDVLLVARADYELVMPEMRVFLHDVPENRLAAYLHHRLGDKL